MFERWDSRENGAGLLWLSVPVTVPFVTNTPGRSFDNSTRCSSSERMQ